MNATDTITIDSVQYNPTHELGINNWIDGFEVRTDDSRLEVFVKAETRGIMGSPEVREVNVGVSRRVGSFKMTVFMAFDPMAINTSPDYYWLGRGDVSLQLQALYNLPIPPAVDDDPNTLNEFSLSQNYPNPFNPSTTIKYSIPVETRRPTTAGSPQNVILKIYDILGREIATLVNRKQKAGNYEVQFNAKDLTSGIYFYKLQSGNFVESRKMLLLK